MKQPTNQLVTIIRGTPLRFAAQRFTLAAEAATEGGACDSSRHSFPRKKNNAVLVAAWF